jgi:hypothetical protein
VASVVRSTLHDLERGTEYLRQAMPRIRQAPGFVSGTWVMLGEGSGTSMIIFESEEGAQAWIEQLKADPAPSEAVTIHTVEIGEVVEQA